MHLTKFFLVEGSLLHASVLAKTVEKAEEKFRLEENLARVLSRGGVVKPTTPTSGST
jgi:hypothetical protein